MRNQIPANAASPVQTLQLLIGQRGCLKDVSLMALELYLLPK